MSAQVERAAPADPEEPFIYCENLVKIYKIADIEVMALQGLDLSVKKGEVMAIIGASGSGKSTLLNVLGGLDAPSAGIARVAGINLARMNQRQRLLYRRNTVGFVWQNVGRNLIPYLSALENVEMPMILAGKHDRRRARRLLEAVGLGERIHHKPMHMSGGEQQRVAIAIALANDPPLLLADEPTGSLDSENAARVLEVFNRVRDEYGVTVVIVTHDPAMARAVDRWVEIRDGKTSWEAVRRTRSEPAEAGGEGAVREESHDQYALLDSAGRLQLPKEFLRRWGIRDRVELAVEEDRVVIRPPREGAGREGAQGAGEASKGA